MRNPELAANRVLDELEIGGPEDLRELELVAFARGAMVRYSELHGSEARIAMIGDRAVITVSSHVTRPQRRRFSVAHELGHLEMHRRKAPLILCVDDDLGAWQFGELAKDLEVQANQFAASLLLPDRLIAPRITNAEPSIEHIVKLAEEFDTSLTATAIRYSQLTAEPVFVAFSQGGLVKWFWPSRFFQELKEELQIYIETQVRLSPESLAARVFSKGSSRAEAKQVPASAWLASDQLKPDASVLEQCIPMPRYSAVLSLLWVNEEIDDDDELF